MSRSIEVRADEATAITRPVAHVIRDDAEALAVARALAPELAAGAVERDQRRILPHAELDAEAADGFNIMPPFFPGPFAAFVDLVVPELQRRGLFRQDYEGATLREQLGLARPVSRHATSQIMLLGIHHQKTREEKRMSKILDEVLAANAAYAADFGDKGGLRLPPARQFAVLTCMDARLDPAKYAGLAEGDAHVIRNAGGRASDDAIRSLVISYKLLGTKEWLVVHHTDCGMELFTDDIIAGLLDKSLETASIDAQGWHDPGHGAGSVHGHFVKWHTIADLEQSVVEDVARIRSHPLVPGRIPIYGYIYDVRSGRLIEVPEATNAGKAA